MFEEKYVGLAEQMASFSRCKRRKVGAVLVDTGCGLVFMGCNHNTTASTECECAEGKTLSTVAHAEIAVLGMLAKQATGHFGHLGSGPYDLYVTHQPCLACAQVIAEHDVRAVYYRDADDKHSGLKYLQDHGVRVWSWAQARALPKHVAEGIETEYLFRQLHKLDYFWEQHRFFNNAPDWAMCAGTGQRINDNYFGAAPLALFSSPPELINDSWVIDPTEHFSVNTNHYLVGLEKRQGLLVKRDTRLYPRRFDRKPTVTDIEAALAEAIRHQDQLNQTRRSEVPSKYQDASGIMLEDRFSYRAPFFRDKGFVSSGTNDSPPPVAPDSNSLEIEGIKPTERFCGPERLEDRAKRLIREAGGTKVFAEKLRRFQNGGFYDPLTNEVFLPNSKGIESETFNLPAKPTEAAPADEKSPARSATQIMGAAAGLLDVRASEYDQADGERSAGRAAQVWSIITGKHMKESEAWLFLQLLKDVRQWQNPERYHRDSAEDCVAYAGLKAEALERETNDQNPSP